MTVLFIDHQAASALAEQIEKARLAVRRARRFTTKLESERGQECNRDLALAEQELDAALGKIR